MFRKAAVSRTYQKERLAGNSEVGIEADGDVTRAGDLLKEHNGKIYKENSLGIYCEC
jgi:hypothetical protein